MFVVERMFWGVMGSFFIIYDNYCCFFMIMHFDFCSRVYDCFHNSYSWYPRLKFVQISHECDVYVPMQIFTIFFCIGNSVSLITILSKSISAINIV